MNDDETTKKVIKAAVCPTPGNLFEVGYEALDGALGRILPNRRVAAESRRMDEADQAAQIEATHQRIREIHELFVKRDQRWAGVDESEMPTLEDTWDVLRRIGEMWGKAGDPNKRDMIRKAFFLRLAPSFIGRE